MQLIAAIKVERHFHRHHLLRVPQHDHRLLVDCPPPCEIQPSAQLIVLSGLVDSFIGVLTVADEAVHTASQQRDGFKRPLVARW